MKRRSSESGRISLPYTAFGIVVVGLGVATTRHFSVASEPPADPHGINREVTRFDLLQNRTGISASDRGAVRIPLLEFDVDTPPTKSNVMAAWLQGEDGARLPLIEVKKESSFRTFSRLGYAQPLKSPHLVVQNDGQTVVDKPVAAFPAPMRAIPLVVPIDRSIRLKPLNEKQAKALAKRYPDHRFFTMETSSGTDSHFPSHILRGEWTANAEVAFRPKETKRVPVFALSKEETGRIVELDRPRFDAKVSVKNADLEVETFFRDGQPGLRVLKPLTIEFMDGARTQIQIQERMATGAKPAFGLSIHDLPGWGPMMVPDNKPFAILPTMPPERDSEPLPKMFEGIKVNRMTLVSPPLDEVGISRLRIGEHQVSAKDQTIPLKPGRYKLRLRFTRKIVQGMDERRFVEIESPTGPQIRNKG